MPDLTCGPGGSAGAEVIADINDNTVNIASMLGYNVVDNQDIVDIPETYTNLATLDVVDLQLGKYLIGISFTYQYDTVQKSVFSRFTLNGGVPEEFSKEPKDSTDREAVTYIFPYTQTSVADFSLVLDMRKEDATGILDCHYANLWIEKKADYVP